VEIEELARHCIDRGYRLHRDLGPDLLENVYERVMCECLRREGLQVSCQQPVAVQHDGIVIENGFRYDLLVEDKLLIEVISSERHAAVHAKQVLTYLRLLDLRLGLLMNFGMGTFKEGVQRLVNNYRPTPR
jgi:iron complex transport system substrate-binding protein